MRSMIIGENEEDVEEIWKVTILIITIITITITITITIIITIIIIMVIISNEEATACSSSGGGGRPSLDGALGRSRHNKIHKFKADNKDRVMDLTTMMNMTMIKMIRTPFKKWNLTTRPESPIS